jgi:large subunit ribosomal protein L35Ae
MEGIIKNFRRGRNTQYHRQFIIEIKGVKNRSDALKLLGRKVVWKSVKGKTIKGKICKPHGNNGAVRALFSRGLPGTAIGEKVQVL